MLVLCLLVYQVSILKIFILGYTTILKQELKAEINEDQLRIIENADRIEDEIDGLNDDDVRKRLLRDHGRD